MRYKQITYSVFHLDMVMCGWSELHIYIYIYMVKVNYICICIMFLKYDKLTWYLAMNSLKTTLVFVAKLGAEVSF